jgi:hypothetical protein
MVGLVGQPGDIVGMAQAVRINTSLQYLYMWGNQAEQSSGIEAEFVEALRLKDSSKCRSEVLTRSAATVGYVAEPRHDPAAEC